MTIQLEKNELIVIGRVVHSNKSILGKVTNTFISDERLLANLLENIEGLSQKGVVASFEDNTLTFIISTELVTDIINLYGDLATGLIKTVLLTQVAAGKLGAKWAGGQDA